MGLTRPTGDWNYFNKRRFSIRGSKLFFSKISKNFESETKIKKPYIEGEFEDIEEDDERKL